MVTAMVTVQHNRDYKWTEIGPMEYAVVPRLGDVIEVPVNKVPYAFRVAMVIHPPVPGEVACEIRAVYEGKTGDMTRAALKVWR